MQTIEELNKHSLLDQIASCTTSSALSCGDDRLAAIRGFELVFKQLVRTPAIIRMLLHKKYNFGGQIDASVNVENEDELLRARWFDSTFVVPNYSKMVNWSAKMALEAEAGRIVVGIIPNRTNTKWFHDNVIAKATEIIFIKGRLQFPGFKKQSPFPDVVVIYNPNKRIRGVGEIVDSAVGLDMTKQRKFKNSVAIVTSLTGNTTVSGGINNENVYDEQTDDDWEQESDDGDEMVIESENNTDEKVKEDDDILSEPKPKPGKEAFGAESTLEPRKKHKKSSYYVSKRKKY